MGFCDGLVILVTLKGPDNTGVIGEGSHIVIR
jgi:hypothetical protein